MNLDNKKLAINGKMDTREEMELAGILKSWTAIHSNTGNLSGLSRMLEVLKNAFSSLEGEMEEIALPAQLVINHKGEKEERPLGKALRVRKNKEAKIQLFFGGHMDTVPVQKGENELEGVGVADMKGGLLVLLKGLELFEKSEHASKVGWEVLIVPDEEIGSPGSKSLFEEAAKTYDIGLLFEPSLPDGSLVSARKGSLNAAISAKGLPAHAGREHHLGRNAVTALAEVAVEAEKLTDPESGITVNIGRIEGGGPVNVVPDRAILYLNIRLQKPSQVLQIKEQLESILQDTALKREVILEYHELSLRPPKLFDERTKSLFESLKKTADTLGIRLQWRETGGACDGNTLGALGLPTIDTLGVVGGNLHTAQEYIILESLPQRIGLLAAFLEQIAEGVVTLPKEHP